MALNASINSVSFTPCDITVPLQLLRCRILNALVNRSLFQQLLLELRIREEPLLDGELCESGCHGSVETISSSKDTGSRFLVEPCVSYLITLSARATTLGGIFTPICFAVLRLTTNSNLVGRSIGSS